MIASPDWWSKCRSRQSLAELVGPERSSFRDDLVWCRDAPRLFLEGLPALDLTSDHEDNATPILMVVTQLPSPSPTTASLSRRKSHDPPHS